MVTKKNSNDSVWVDAEALFSEVNNTSRQPQGIVGRDGLPQGAIDFLTAERQPPSAEDEAAWSLTCEIQKRKAKLLELGKNANQSNTERTATWDYEEKLQAEIEELEFKLRGASVVGSTPAPQAIPTVPVVDSAHTEEWKLKAQEHARAIIERDRKKDLYPSQELVADEVARTLRESGIFGVSGKPLTGAYIKRHALDGISSAQGKRQSTAIHRGK